MTPHHEIGFGHQLFRKPVNTIRVSVSLWITVALKPCILCACSSVLNNVYMCYCMNACMYMYIIIMHMYVYICFFNNRQYSTLSMVTFLY